MNKGNRSKGTAVLRTLLDKDKQNFATKRLIRDLKEIEDERIPTVGVVARPTEQDLFLWHANIRGPKDTPYEDGVFHFELEIPESYPHQPPQIRCMTELPHPNVIGNEICLDILQPTRGKDGSGWSSSYSIQSILLQLQSFLFEENFDEQKEKWIQKVKKAVKAANEYTSPDGQHKGQLGCWPPFNTKENDLSNFILKYDQKADFRKELICYHTKVDHEVNPIGLGLSITKLPRTGAIKQAIPYHDYVSIKAFIKEGIRWSAANERFNLWIPLYFGLNKMDKDRTLHMAQKSISMIISNNTKRFKEDDVIEVFTKIIITMIFMIMEDKYHASIRIIRIFSHIHALALLLMEKYPNCYEKLEQNVEEFVKDPAKRHKDFTPNLGTLMASLLFTTKAKFEDVVEAYTGEQLDRQVMWLLRSIPELEPKGADKKPIDLTDVNRPQVSFKAELTSYHILCFYKLYLNTVQKALSPKELLEAFEKNLCKLPNQIQNEIQKGIHVIREEVNDYSGYYKFLGLKEKTTEELNKMLIDAVASSKAKQYHGSIEELNTLPSNTEQIRALNSKLPKLEDFFDIKIIKPTVKVEQKKAGDAAVHKNPAEIKKEHEVKYEIKIKRDFQDEEWKDACLNRWIWIREALDLNNKLTSSDITQIYLTQYKNPEISVQNRINTYIQEKEKKKLVTFERPQIPIPNQSWKKLFLMMDLVDFLLQLDANPDFEQFYEQLEVSKNDIDLLVIPIYNVRNIKSGFHFLTSILTKLRNLKYLEISGNPSSNNLNLPPKASKCLYKGFCNFQKLGGSLEMICFSNFRAEGNNNDILERFFTPIGFMPNLVSIRFYGTNLLQIPNASKSLGNIITNIKNLQELILTKNALLNVVQAKDIADGIMRAKQLRFIDVSENNCTTAGLGAIIYNLAFSPQLVYLNISQNVISGSVADISESLYKMLRISASLEILDLSSLSNLNPALSKDFFSSLGEIKTLKYITFQNSGIFNDTTNLGKSIAFNAQKKGSLELINFENCYNSIGQLTNLHTNLCISDHDEELWYGDLNKANKMSGQDFNKVYFNNLRSFLLSGSTGLSSNFNLNHFQQYNQPDPAIMQLFARTPLLETVLLSRVGLNQNDAEMLVLALDPTRANFCSKVRILDLSKNAFGKEGAKIFAQLFEINNIIESVDLSNNGIGVSGAQAIAKSLSKNTGVKFLNLFNNQIGFDGAEALKETLKTNNVIQHLELGHNRIRDRGFQSLAEGIRSNPNNSLKILSVRFNFITDDGAIEFFKTIKDSKYVLNEVNLKNNSINEYGLYQFKKSFDLHKLNMNVDIFEKLKYLNSDRLERSVWIHPIVATAQEYKQFFEECQKCGIVIDIRVRKGPSYPNRTVQANHFAIVEFADSASCNRALQVASRKQANLNGQVFRIYKAGTGTFIYSQQSAKEKKAECSKTNKLGDRAPRVPAAAGRGRGRGGARGRGRGGR